MKPRNEHRSSPNPLPPTGQVIPSSLLAIISAIVIEFALVRLAELEFSPGRGVARGTVLGPCALWA